MQAGLVPNQGDAERLTHSPQELWGCLAAVCPQAPRPGWPSLAGLAGFGCTHACSVPAPG